MEQKKDWLIIWLVLLFLVFLAAAELYPQSYQILEPELTRLEQISQTYKTDRQNWQSQAQKLNKELIRLQPLVTSLNSQLSVERTQTQTLRQSFEQLEKDRLSEKALLIADKEKRETDYNDLNVKYLKTKSTRNILGMILGIEIICALGLIVWKFRKRIPF